MASASHSLAAEGGTRPSPFGVFDDPRYAQIAVGRAKQYQSAVPFPNICIDDFLLGRSACSRYKKGVTSCASLGAYAFEGPMNPRADELPVKFAARAQRLLTGGCFAGSQV
jgi:hypothetical protein